MKKKNINNEALIKWGYGLQIIKTIEEMAELTQAISKFWRHYRLHNEIKTTLTSKIAEEIADVEIMLEQMKGMANCHIESSLIKEGKLKRLRKHLKI